MTEFLRRRVFRHFVVPVLRGKHPPELAARGVFFGLLIGLTPTVGIQIPLLLLLWVSIRAVVPRWHFNLLVAIAWSFVSNVFTAPVLYYVFVVTGRLMLGRWDRLRGYDVFEDRLQASLDPAAGPFETAWAYMSDVVDTFGLPLVLGCIPWAAVVSSMGYRWSLKVIVLRRSRRARRRPVRAPRPDHD